MRAAGRRRSRGCRRLCLLRKHTQHFARRISSKTAEQWSGWAASGMRIEDGRHRSVRAKREQGHGGRDTHAQTVCLPRSAGQATRSSRHSPPHFPWALHRFVWGMGMGALQSTSPPWVCVRASPQLQCSSSSPAPWRYVHEWCSRCRSGVITFPAVRGTISAVIQTRLTWLEGCTRGESLTECALAVHSSGSKEQRWTKTMAWGEMAGALQARAKGPAALPWHGTLELRHQRT